MKLLYFTAKWCQPCKAVGPMIEEICKANDVNCHKIDVDGDPQKAVKYGVRGIPTLLAVDKNDKPVSAITGQQTRREYEKFIQSFVQGA